MRPIASRRARVPSLPRLHRSTGRSDESTPFASGTRANSRWLALRSSEESEGLEGDLVPPWTRRARSRGSGGAARPGGRAGRAQRELVPHGAPVAASTRVRGGARGQRGPDRRQRLSTTPMSCSFTHSTRTCCSTGSGGWRPARPCSPSRRISIARPPISSCRRSPTAVSTRSNSPPGARVAARRGLRHDLAPRPAAPRRRARLAAARRASRPARHVAAGRAHHDAAQPARPARGSARAGDAAPDRRRAAAGASRARAGRRRRLRHLEAGPCRARSCSPARRTRQRSPSCAAGPSARRAGKGSVKRRYGRPVSRNNGVIHPLVRGRSQKCTPSSIAQCSPWPEDSPC